MAGVTEGKRNAKYDLAEPRTKLASCPRLSRASDLRQVLVDLALEFGAAVGAQGTDHEDPVGFIGFAGGDFEIEDQVFGLRR
jgi:thymidine phosphorylase